MIKIQTFLPYRSFERSAQVLDNKRLGKQRVETLQIMKALTQGVGWRNHPATLMWVGHEAALLRYQAAICQEWVNRGFKDTCFVKTVMLYAKAVPNADITSNTALNPSWLGKRKMHSGHRSNLLRKDPVHYGQFGWTDDPEGEYWWPVQR